MNSAGGEATGYTGAGRAALARWSALAAHTAGRAGPSHAVLPVRRLPAVHARAIECSSTVRSSGVLTDEDATEQSDQSHRDEGEGRDEPANDSGACGGDNRWSLRRSRSWSWSWSWSLRYWRGRPLGDELGGHRLALFDIFVVLWICVVGHVIRVILEPTRIVWTSFLPPQSFPVPLCITPAELPLLRATAGKTACAEEGSGRLPELWQGGCGE